MSKEERDIRIYYYRYGTLVKSNYIIAGRKKSIHKCKSILEAMKCIEEAKKRFIRHIPQFVLIDYTEKHGGEIIYVDTE